MGEKTIEQLATGGYHTVEDIYSEADLIKLGRRSGIGIKKARQLKHAVEQYLRGEAKLREELDAEKAKAAASPAPAGQPEGGSPA